MSRLVLSLARASVGALALLSAGCLQVENKFIVYPDGSGRVVTTMKMDQNALEMMKGMNPGGGQGEGQENPMSGREMKGLVGGQKMTIVTEGIFSDINQVEGQGVKFAWTRLKNGGNKLKLDVDLAKAGGPGMGAGMGMGLGGGDAEKKEAGKDAKNGDKKGESLVDKEEGGDDEEEGGGGGLGDMAQQLGGGMMKGMSFKYVVVMPGAVGKSSSKLIDGRTVTLALDGAAMMQAKKTHSLTASCAAADDTVTAEYEAFKKELAEAQKGAGGAAAPKNGGDAKGGGNDAGDEDEK